MNWSCYLYILACSVTLSTAQGTDEGCSNCALGKFFESGFEDWILPAAAGALQFLEPDSSPAPDAIPEEPEEQGMNDYPGVVKEPDIETESIASPDNSQKCDRNGDGSTFCAVATAQIIWPLPAPCGDEAQAQRILNEIYQLAPKVDVRSFHNKCGTWFFTASLSPSQIQQLMDQNIGIKFIEPDVEMENNTETPSKLRKRGSNKVHTHRELRVRERYKPDDEIMVEHDQPGHMAEISAPPAHRNPERDYAYFRSAGDEATIYWIDWEFYVGNTDLEDYPMAENRLMAEGISQEWERPTSDHGGCMLSIISGVFHGLLNGWEEREERQQLKMVKVNPPVSSFFSGIQAIITELELRIERNERVSTWTVIGTSLTIRPGRLGGMLRIAAAILFKILLNLQAVIVVSTGHMGSDSQPLDVFPANFARYESLPILVAASARCDDNSYIPGPPNPFTVLSGPGYAYCGHLDGDIRIEGDSPAVAIVTALAVDMLTRTGVRSKLFIDNPDQAPAEGRLAALRPVSAKIRDYLDSLSYARQGSQLKCVWNGLDPRQPDITQYYP